MRKLNISKSKLIKLNKGGLSDTQIGKVLGVQTSMIWLRRKQWEIKPNGGVTKNGKFYKQTQIPKELLQPLVEKELSDYKIAKILGYNQATIYNARLFYKLNRRNLTVAVKKRITKKQLELLIGHVLGDGHLNRRQSINAHGVISQGEKQKLYAEWKVKNLSSLCSELKKRVRNIPDKRNGLYYVSYDASIHANPNLNWLYDAFYKNGKKDVPEEIIELVTPLSLAVWFMDDGHRTECSVSIATNAFKRQDVIKKIFQKFGIEVRFHKQGATYIPAKYFQKFKNLIEPYILPSMEYKLA